MNAMRGRSADDVREVLLGADAEIDAARLDVRCELRDDVLERVLVRDEVVRVEEAVRLGEVFDEAPELRVGQAGRMSVRARRCRTGPARRPTQPAEPAVRATRGAARRRVHRDILTIGVCDAGCASRDRPQPRVSACIVPRPFTRPLPRPAAAALLRPDERARLVERHRRDVGAERRSRCRPAAGTARRSTDRTP